MIPLPPPPPPLPPPFSPPPPQNEVKLSPLKQMFASRQGENQHLLPPDLPYSNKIKPREYPKVKRLNRTNPIIWCTAVLCLIFSILLIFFGIATLIIFLHIKPRSPVFDAPSASLSVLYINSPELFFNSDFVFLANFSNPNENLGIKFEYLDIELYFHDSLIAAQALQPFTQLRGETRLASIHMISSLVYLPSNLLLEWLHAKCQLELTSPPTGVLVGHSCTTKR